jgi:hypothetical protein
MVMLIQLLCPERHCVMAGAYEQGAETFESAVKGMKAQMQVMGVADYCGICGSIHLEYEEQATTFETLRDALKPLLVLQAVNLKTRAKMDAEGKTYDSARRN